MSEIRQVTGEDRLRTAFTLYPYAFDESPNATATEDLERVLPFHEGNHTLVVEERGRTVATASAIPAHQNLRGHVVRMAGIAWVATHPDARRKGHSTRLVRRLHRDLRDSGHLLATLYPFHPAFYDRLGYIGLPLNRTATFAPEGLAPLLHANLPGEVSRLSVRDGFAVQRAFQRRLLTRLHGFVVTPDYRAVRALAAADRWLAVATVDGEVHGVLAYRIDGFGGCLRTDELLYGSPLGRALLLRFLAQHTHQVSRVTVTVAPDEWPETWATCLTVRSEAEAAYPLSPPLMARLLSVEALRGVHCGPGRIVVEVVDDDIISGDYLLDGTAGTMEIATSGGAEEKATLTAAGLSGLAYGVLDPTDVVARGLGEVTESAAAQLRALFPRRTPYAFGKG